jgi:hypothetical protein
LNVPPYEQSVLALELGTRSGVSQYRIWRILRTLKLDVPVVYVDLTDEVGGDTLRRIFGDLSKFLTSWC